MYEVYGLTDVGRIREHNEDCFLINGVVHDAGEDHAVISGDFIVAVADGVGGQNAGEVASRIALSELASLSLPLTLDQLEGAIQEINRIIFAYGQTHAEAQGLATTLAGVICIDNLFTIYHVGDSRVYRFTNGFLRLMTKDDSLVQVLFESGAITREQIFNHPQSHIVTQSLGSKEQPVQIDMETMRRPLPDDDIILICSDGLNDLVRDEEMENIIAAGATLPEVVKNLVSAAKVNGGRDNITCVAVRRQTDV